MYTAALGFCVGAQDLSSSKAKTCAESSPQPVCGSNYTKSDFNVYFYFLIGSSPIVFFIQCCFCVPSEECDGIVIENLKGFKIVFSYEYVIEIKTKF